jgi:Tfp pilus assembly protein PilF
VEGKMASIPERLQAAAEMLRNGQSEQARSIYEQVLALDANQLDALLGLARLRWQAGDLQTAEHWFARAARAAPDSAVVQFHLGNILQMQDRHDDAIACYRRALRLQPDLVEAQCNLGTTLRDLGRLDEALVQLQQAVGRRPDMAQAQGNLGAVWHALGQLDEAQACFERAVRLDPSRAERHFSLGSVLRDRGYVDSAIASYDRAVELEPDFSIAIVNRGTAQLSAGRFAPGWADYEHRIGSVHSSTLKLPEPLWQGEPLASGRLLVHCEQGLGDTLQFVRYLPRVRQLAPNATLAADACLLPLLAASGFGPLVAKEGPLPSCDAQIPLMSLPRIFGTRLDNVPAPVPYLAVEAPRIDRWHTRLQQLPGFRIGIAWQGRPSYPGDRQRSIALEHFAALARVDGVRLFSLQKGPGSEQIAAFDSCTPLVDLGPSIDHSDGAFLDTAAVMQSLDLVITSDTAVAHLAGALARPVWVALSAAPDWRWMFDREDSPWYPTMRLFRQQELGRWDQVFQRMADALRQLV